MVYAEHLLAFWESEVLISTNFPGGSVVKNPPANAGDIRDTGLTPRSGRSPGGRHGHTLWYSCLENPTDRGACRATVHGLTRVRHDLQLNHHDTVLSV